MKLNNVLAIITAAPFAFAALTPGPAFTRLDKNDAVRAQACFPSELC